MGCEDVSDWMLTNAACLLCYIHQDLYSLYNICSVTVHFSGMSEMLLSKLKLLCFIMLNFINIFTATIDYFDLSERLLYCQHQHELFSPALHITWIWSWMFASSLNMGFAKSYVFRFIRHCLMPCIYFSFLYSTSLPLFIFTSGSWGSSCVG